MLSTLWKFVQNAAGGTKSYGAAHMAQHVGAVDAGRHQPRIELCSACRGDYEDPDASAKRDDSSPWGDDDGNEESDEEFPARRERR
jgi:hypothetical protein